MLRKEWRLLSPALLWGLAACVDNIGPKIGACQLSDGFPLALGVGAYINVNPTLDSACVRFPANLTADTVEYLVVPQIGTGVPGATLPFSVTGDSLPAPAPLTARLARGEPTPAERFHTMLRLGDEEHWLRLNPSTAPAGPAGLTPARAASAGPPAYGHVRQFRVCGTLDCSTFPTVTATARAVKSKVAIYVDNAAPAGGLDSLDLDSLATVFDTLLYAVDTAAFGRESDIDTNSVVLVLMTPVVNALVNSSTCASSGFVAGFFLGADLDPLFRTDSRSNKGEVFYSFVADPSGSVSCAHSATDVKRFVPVTFIHEFQHMISFNQHVLARGGAAEVLWLNEALSHYAEELGGRAHGVGTASFSRFTIGNVFNAYKYLDSTRNHFLLPTAGIGSLTERGGGWLFLRYVVDRYATDTTMAAWNVVTRKLSQTSLTGAQNIAAQTGDPFVRIATGWALANWVSDLPAFTPPVELRYRSWSFRTTYASLYTQDSANFKKPFPLTPTTSDAEDASLTGTLLAGSGFYHRVFQAPGAGAFALRFTSASGFVLPANRDPRLNLIRIR